MLVKNLVFVLLAFAETGHAQLVRGENRNLKTGGGGGGKKGGSKAGPPGINNKCVTQADVIDRIQSFADAVPSISKAYRDAGGGQAGSATEAGCKAAYDAATGALAAAYGYDGKVLFKPTYTTEPYTYRTTLAGALSYFIGTECLLLVGGPDEQFPPGNDGSMFQEYGFALNNAGDRQGWDFPTEWDPAKFSYRIDPDGGQNCDTAVAMGRMCFTQGDGSGKACVDKTFGFNERLDGQVVFTSHHSSAAINEAGSIMICQEGSTVKGECP